MKVFVTGGNGFIGSRVVRLLCERGDTVRCLVRETSNTSRIDDLSFERHLGDIRDINSLIEGMKGMDACIHLASVSSWDQIRSDDVEDIIIDGTKKVLEACKQLGNLRTIFVSSSVAVNASNTPTLFDESSPFELEGSPLRYAVAKHKAEQCVQTYIDEGLPIITVNPVEVYGPEDNDFITAGNIRDILKDWPALACTGGTAIAHVDDIAAGMVAAMDKGRVGERYILGGDNVTVEELVRLTLDIDGQKKPVIKLPNGPMRWTIQTMAKLGIPTPVIPDVLDYATRFFFMDCTKAKTELGYNPRPARQTLEPVVRWLRDAGHVE